MKTLKQAILDAANWLEANPAKHIKFDLSVKKNGFVCSPMDPEAECFCAVGRIVKELSPTAEQMSFTNTSSVYDFTEPLLDKFGLQSYEFFAPNDSAPSNRTVQPHCPNVALSGPASIENMRAIAEKVA